MRNELKRPVIFVFSTANAPFIGGAEIAIEQVAKRLKGESASPAGGFDFIIFTSRMRRDLPKREVRDEGLVVRVGFGTKFDKFWLLFFGWLAAWRELKKQRRKILFWVMDFSFGAAPVSLGPFVLRTETAAMYMLSVLNFFYREIDINSP